MTPELAAAEANYLAAWRLLAGYADGGQVDETDAVLFTSIPAPVAYFNSAFVKPDARVSDCLDDIAAYFAAKQVPFTVRFRDGDTTADSACAARNLQPDGASPVMWCDVDAIGAPVGDIRVVDADTLGDYVATMAAGFEMPEALSAAMLTAESLGDDNYALILAYDDGAPVATAALVVSDDVAGVYNVSTPVAHRRRGFGEDATRFAVAEGIRRGCTRTTLQASAMGFPIYARMGYRTLGEWRTYTGGPS